MNEAELNARVSEILGQCTTLSAGDRAKVSALANSVQQRHASLSKSLASLQESLDYLRLSVKYLVFDLEATRRENESLRARLEESQGDTGAA